MFYIVIGIVLLLLSAGTIAVMVLFEIRDRRAGNIQQGKRLPKKLYSQAFLDAVPRAYESAGTLRGMLTLLVEQCPKENGRAKAALDYLEHSRYQDYETALAYLSDSSAVCEKQIREVLKREIQKTTALTQKFGAAYIGLAFFITMPLVAGILMFLMIRVFHIGE